MRFNLIDRSVTPWLVNNLTRAIPTPVIVSGEAAYFTEGGLHLIRAGKGAP